MIMDFARPAPALQKYITGYYLLEGSREEVAQKVSTWSRPFLIINYGDDFQVVSKDNDSISYAQGITCSGVFSRPMHWGKGIENLKFAAVELRPEVAAAILRENMANLVDFAVQNLSVFKSILWLCDSLHSAPDNVQKVEILDQGLMKFFASRKIDFCSTCFELIDTIDEFKGNLTVPELKKKTGLSRNTLYKKFRDITGVSPGHYAKIVRIEYAVARILFFSEQNKNYHDLIYDLGYYDQAHFIHDIKSATGCTPLELSQSPGYDCPRGIFFNRLY